MLQARDQNMQVKTKALAQSLLDRVLPAWDEKSD